jgi:LacI family transcriptional regulator
VIEAPFSFEGGWQALREIWQRGEPVTDFDDIELAMLAQPPLTTVRVPSLEIGVRAARYVVDGQPMPCETPLEAPVIERKNLARIGEPPFHALRLRP